LDTQQTQSGTYTSLQRTYDITHTLQSVVVAQMDDNNASKGPVSLDEIFACRFFTTYSC